MDKDVGDKKDNPIVVDLFTQLSMEVGIVGNVRSMSTNIQEARARKLTNSINMMDEHLGRNNKEHENELRLVQERHRMAFNSQVDDFEQQLADIRQQLRIKDDDIDKLRGRLNECREAKSIALEENLMIKQLYEGKLKELGSHIEESGRKINALRAEKEKLKMKLSNVDSFQGALDQKESALKETHIVIQTLNDKLNRMESVILAKEEIIGRMESEKERMETTMKTLQDQNGLLNKQLNDIFKNAQNEVESGDHVRKVLEDQMDKVQKELEELKATLSYEVGRNRKLETEMDSVNHSNGLLKIDIRIANRQNKELQGKLSEKEDQLETASKNLTSMEKTIAELNSKIPTLEEAVQMLKTQAQERESDYQALIKIMEGIKEQNSQLEHDNSSLTNQLQLVNVQMQDYQHIKLALSQKDELIAEKAEIVASRDRLIKEQREQINTLKQLVTSLDEDLVRFEAGLTNKLADLDDAVKIKELTEVENLELRDKLKKSKIELNEAKSLKAFTEKRLELTETNLRAQSQSKESEVHSMMERLAVATKRNEELSEELTALMTKNSNLEEEKFDLRKKVETLTSEKDRLGKHLNSCVKAVVDTKEENITLQNALKEIVTKAETHKEKSQEALSQLSALEQTKKMNDLRHATKIEQQEKLISHLFEKLEVYERKKKKPGFFTPKRVFADKEHFTPAKTTAAHSIQKQQNLVEKPLTSHSLEEEQMAVSKLEEKRAKLRNQLQDMQQVLNTGGTPVSRKNPTLPAPRREENILLKERSNTISVTHGKTISASPHKFVETRCETPERCHVCSEPIYKTRPLSQCTHCTAVFHLACTSTAGNTCEAHSPAEKKKSLKRKDIEKEIQGYVTVRSESMVTAEKRYAKIENSKLLLFLTDGNKSRPIEVFSLNEKTKRYFRVENSEDEHPSGKIKSALPIKITFYDEQDTPSVLFVFPKTFAQKRTWIAVVDKYSKGNTYDVSSNSASDDENKENETFKLAEKLVWEDQSRRNFCVNCIYFFPDTQIYLLGCEDGLYSVKCASGKLVKIKGPKSIHQITILEEAKLAVFVEGPKGVLTTSYLDLLKSCAEAAQCSLPKCPTKVVPHSQDCYLLVGKSTSEDDAVVAAASNKDLLIAKLDDGELIVKRRFLLTEAITTLLMTPSSTVLYGCETVYEMDVKTYQKEAFLDETDDAILFMQILNEAHGSYPVAILDVTKSGGSDATEEEYLVCFQDIGVFVDSTGRRSRRGDITWGHVPVSFAYRHPFLYIFNFSQVEIQKLDVKSYTRVSQGKSSKEIIIPERRFLKIVSKSTPNFVGEGKEGCVVTFRDTLAMKLMEIQAS